MPPHSAARIYASPPAIVLREVFPAFDGPIANGPYLRLGLCMRGGGLLSQVTGNTRLEGQWRAGRIAITLPHATGYTTSAQTDVLGLAIDLSSYATECQPTPAHLMALAGGLIDDALMRTALIALWHEAQIHGVSSAYFAQSTQRILQRLREIPAPSGRARKASPLSSARLDRLIDFVDAHREEAISVPAMAAACGLDPSGFTRALRHRTGLTPYAWLTCRRMDYAKTLLNAGQTITQTAQLLGYTNASKFTAAFTRVHGASPSQWRRDMGKSL